MDPRDGWGATVMYAQLFRPRAVVIENVADAPVAEWEKAIQEATGLPRAGSFKLVANDFGVPQVRPRAFVYAGPAPLSTFLSEVERHKRPARSVADVLPYLKGHYVRSEQTTARARTTEQACPTIPTKGNLYIHKIDVGTRRVGYRRDPEVSRLATPEETAALTGFPLDYPLSGGVKARYKLVGNAVAPAVAEAIGLAVKSLLARGSR
jgi:DNA (cytosine-5)-methyltransferase 1